MSYCTPDDVNFQSGVQSGYLTGRSVAQAAQMNHKTGEGRNCWFSHSNYKTIDPTEILLSRYIREAQN